MSTNSPDNNSGDTIVSIPRPSKLRPLIDDKEDAGREERVQETEFKIRLANTEGRRSRASFLIKRRYAWRGYQASPLAANVANMITLGAFDQGTPIATITVGIDSPAGLAIEKLYPEEARSLRSSGAHLCEFTKLAVDNMIRSKAVLAAIFHIAYIYAKRLRGATDLLIEVNPRHVRFYESMLGFKAIGSEKIDPRVNAPAVLLWLALSYAESQISQWGGHRELADQTRMLYPFFFSAAEERGIEGRLRSME